MAAARGLARADYNALMTRFADLVDTSRRVASTPARNAKIAAMAAFLQKLEPAEISVAVAYLSGETLQGRFGIG